jgi:hypothetical protein
LRCPTCTNHEPLQGRSGGGLAKESADVAADSLEGPIQGSHDPS